MGFVGGFAVEGGLVVVTLGALDVEVEGGSSPSNNSLLGISFSAT